MLKSPEEYLSSLSFDLPEQEPDAPNLDAAERVFVEKYLGSDSLPDIPLLEPEPVPLPLLAQPRRASSLPRQAPEIIVVPPTPILEVAQEAPDKTTVRQTVQLAEKIVPQIVVVEKPQQATTEERQETKEAFESEPGHAEVAPHKELVEIRVQPASKVAPVVTRPVVATSLESANKEAITSEAAPAVVSTEIITEKKDSVVQAEIPATPAEAIRAFATVRDRLKQAAEIQAVSFKVADQLFLLPVEGIQEVLRYMDLVKVPQAPEFVAGAINLRGTVMPLIHLSALLTNSKTWKYDERSFIIVTGSSSVQMGLIIDRVSSMHMIPQHKIIWNVESKLGDAAEFLCSIVDLDDRVCGMIAPEVIAQKLLNEF